MRFKVMKTFLFYLLRKLRNIGVTLFLIVSATFFLMKAVPGDPFSQEQSMPKEIIESLHQYYGLDAPWYIQYAKYLKSILFFNLGPSYKYQERTVNGIICEGFPISLVLGLEALSLAIFIGLTLGTLAALRQGKFEDYAILFFSTLCLSLPSFILATSLQYFFAYKLGLFPIARWGTFLHSVLPAISLATAPCAFILRLSRASMIEVLHQDFIKTAQSKGLKQHRMVIFHIWKNAILPIVSYLGPLTVNVVTGSFVVEKIFGVPGLGQWFVSSVINRDYTVIMGLTVFYSTILLIALFIVDILYGLIDPRITSSKTENAV